jgi:hypothetical protein
MCCNKLEISYGDCEIDIILEVEPPIFFNLEVIYLGPPGPRGEDGQDGQSAYQIWLSLGNVGTEQDFLNSLKAGSWEEAETVEVLNPTNMVYDMQFKKQISKIIHISGTPVKWAKMGIIHNRRLDDNAAPGFLDFTNYTLSEDGTISGDFDFWFKQ